MLFFRSLKGNFLSEIGKMMPITHATLKIEFASFCNSRLQFHTDVRGIAGTVQRLAKRIERGGNLSGALDRNYFEECNLLTSRNSRKKLQFARGGMIPSVLRFCINKTARKGARETEYSVFFFPRCFLPLLFSRMLLLFVFLYIFWFD